LDDFEIPPSAVMTAFDQANRAVAAFGNAPIGSPECLSRQRYCCGLHDRRPLFQPIGFPQRKHSQRHENDARARISVFNATVASEALRIVEVQKFGNADKQSVRWVFWLRICPA